MHAINIQLFKKEGVPWVNFDIPPIQNDGKTSVHCEAEIIDRRTVKSSSGISERRYVIKTMVALGDASWEIELTLANRDSMGYRMLLGREAMSGRMLVDPEARFLFGQKSTDHLNELYQPNQPARQGLKIGLLASDPNLYSNQRIMEAGESRGHEMHFLNIRHCYMKLDATNPEIHYRGGRILNDLDAVIPRIRPSQTFYGCALTRQFEALKIFALNSAAAISQSRDKLFSLQLLLQNGLDIPLRVLPIRRSIRRI
ncbi:putative ATP-dependent zinc protease [Prolixibacter bellariivorans]|uniref:putative ATP-dependent zinc protease n=1 Tax=Prolixibacter bellariivorans TaxID=314319 RepID=UPI00278BF39F|nr:RimK/LysX family protein [Prolixibacter bellariivorans]